MELLPRRENVEELPRTLAVRGIFFGCRADALLALSARLRHFWNCSNQLLQLRRLIAISPCNDPGFLSVGRVKRQKLEIRNAWRWSKTPRL